MLELRLFGSGQACYRGQLLEGFPNQQAHTLLCFLVLNRERSHNRERLAALFWGDHSQERARNCLNTALWRLRRVLEPGGIARGTYVRTTETGAVWFNTASDHWLDVDVFERQANQVLIKPVDAMDTSDAETLEAAIQLYTGDLLEGFYDDWAIYDQRRLRRQYLISLAHLMQFYTFHRAYDESLICGQRILDKDPLREETHREMMRVYLASGQRARAVRQYQHCCAILDSELGISPTEETRALYFALTDGANSHQIAEPPAQEPTDYSQALQQLQLARQGFDEAQSRLQQAIQLVEQLKDG